MPDSPLSTSDQLESIVGVYRDDTFSGKRVLVSGGTSGIGLAIAQGFALAGAIVQATGSSRQKIEALRQSASPAGLSFSEMDVQDENAIAAALDNTDALDVLINCQGIARPDQEWEEPTFMQVIDINLSSAMRVSRAAYPKLKKSRGSIINIASMLSYLADEAVPAYTASKSGIVGLTRALAHRYGHDGVRVNAIAPGYHTTEMTKPLWSVPESEARIAQRAAARRWGTVEDLVGPALFLASPAAAFITAAILPVDGGYHVG